jgi:hypothetical protein
MHAVSRGRIFCVRANGNLSTFAFFPANFSVNNFGRGRLSRMDIGQNVFRIIPGGEQLGAYHSVHALWISDSLIKVH